jgi:Tfp pilus assembly protein PilO
MNNWIPKNKTVRFAAITALFSVILYFGSLFLVSRETNKIENAYYSTESDSYKEEKFRAIKAVAETNKEPIQTLQDFFVQKGDEAKFIEQIENIARASGIKFEISSIDVKANQANSFKEDVNVKMKVEGSWQDAMYFIDRLGKMPFGVLVEDVSLNADTPGKWSGSVEFIIFREI